MPFSRRVAQQNALHHSIAYLKKSHPKPAVPLHQRTNVHDDDSITFKISLFVFRPFSCQKGLVHAERKLYQQHVRQARHIVIYYLYSVRGACRIFMTFEESGMQMRPKISTLIHSVTTSVICLLLVSVLWLQMEKTSRFLEDDFRKLLVSSKHSMILSYV